MLPGKHHNPLSSRHVEPAAGGYIFPDDSNLPQLCQRLQAARWRATFVGPCGAGKSTLLSDVCQHLTTSGILTARCQCNDLSRTLPLAFIPKMFRARVVAIDGSEQLLPPLLLLSRMFTRLTGKGILVTAHKPAGPGLMIPVNPSLDALVLKAATLLNVEPAAISEPVSRLFHHHSGNAREVLFDLYVQFENGMLPEPGSQAHD